MRFEDVLHDLIVGDELVLVSRVHLYSIHWNVTCTSKGSVKIRERAMVVEDRTVDCVKNLAIGTTAAALLDLGIVYLQKIVEPGQKICS